jgi:hypothetical protein
MRCSDMFGKCSEIVGTDPDEMDRSAAACLGGEGGARGSQWTMPPSGQRRSSKGRSDGLWPLTGAPQAVRATAEAEAGDRAEEGRRGGGGRNIAFEPQQREGVHRCDASRRWRRQIWRRGMRRRSARRRNASQCDARRSGTARWISRWRWLYSHLHAKCRCCA